eukprot:7701669-Heterocapsa_arctica.AAC.1
MASCCFLLSIVALVRCYVVVDLFLKLVSVGRLRERSPFLVHVIRASHARVVVVVALVFVIVIVFVVGVVVVFVN